MMIKLEWNERIGPLISIKIKRNNYELCFCHLNEERSFYFFGLEKYLCSRCLGILIGTFMGIFTYIYNFNVPFLIHMIIIFPLIFDGFTQLLGFRKSNNIIRFITGLMFGIGFYNLGLV